MKKYIVRDGFVVALKILASDGKPFDKTFVGGEEVSMEEDVAAQHLHKLEFADKKDRDAALKAEQSQKVASMAASDPAALIQQLVAALASAQQSAPGATPPPAA